MHIMQISFILTYNVIRMNDNVTARGENHPRWFYLRVTKNLRRLCFLLDIRPRNP